MAGPSRPASSGNARQPRAAPHTVPVPPRRPWPGRSRSVPRPGRTPSPRPAGPPLAGPTAFGRSSPRAGSCRCPPRRPARGRCRRPSPARPSRRVPGCRPARARSRSAGYRTRPAAVSAPTEPATPPARTASRWCPRGWPARSSSYGHQPVCAAGTARRLVVSVCGAGAAARLPPDAGTARVPGPRGRRAPRPPAPCGRGPDDALAGSSRWSITPYPTSRRCYNRSGRQSPMHPIAVMHMRARVRVRIDVRMGYAENFVRMIHADDTCVPGGVP